MTDAQKPPLLPAGSVVCCDAGHAVFTAKRDIHVGDVLTFDNMEFAHEQFALKRDLAIGARVDCLCHCGAMFGIADGPDPKVIFFPNVKPPRTCH